MVLAWATPKGQTARSLALNSFPLEVWRVGHNVLLNLSPPSIKIIKARKCTSAELGQWCKWSLMVHLKTGQTSFMSHYKQGFLLRNCILLHQIVTNSFDISNSLTLFFKHSTSIYRLVANQEEPKNAVPKNDYWRYVSEGSEFHCQMCWGKTNLCTLRFLMLFYVYSFIIIIIFNQLV